MTFTQLVNKILKENIDEAPLKIPVLDGEPEIYQAWILDEDEGKHYWGLERYYGEVLLHNNVAYKGHDYREAINALDSLPFLNSHEQIKEDKEHLIELLRDVDLKDVIGTYYVSYVEGEAAFWLEVDVEAYTGIGQAQDDLLGF